MNRRGFITGLISLVAAPAIVKCGSLMPVRVIEPYRFIIHTRLPIATWRLLYHSVPINEVEELL